MLMQLAAIWNYLIVILLMMIGLFLVISRANLVKKLVGLSIFQTSVFLFYITLGRVSGGTAPILTDAPDTLYSNPLPTCVDLDRHCRRRCHHRAWSGVNSAYKRSLWFD